ECGRRGGRLNGGTAFLKGAGGFGMEGAVLEPQRGARKRKKKKPLGRGGTGPAIARLGRRRRCDRRAKHDAKPAEPGKRNQLAPVKVIRHGFLLRVEANALLKVAVGPKNSRGGEKNLSEFGNKTAGRRLFYILHLGGEGRKR